MEQPSSITVQALKNSQRATDIFRPSESLITETSGVFHHHFTQFSLILSENGVDFWDSDGDDLRDRNDGRLASYDEAPKQQTYCQGS